MMDRLPATETPDVVVGIREMDDAGVYRVSDGLSLVQTVDFFYPPLNDPAGCGRVVAANCLSDVWAMGARPIAAMNILAYPAGRIPPEAIEAMLAGACEKLREAGVALLGGHTLEQEELVYGLSVTGLASADGLFRNEGARPGDLLILTKPIGTGVYCNALQKDTLTPAQYEAFAGSMERLNMYAADALRGSHPHCVTDVTGFGLLGHALPMARGSGLVFRFEASKVPLLPDALEMLREFSSKGVCKCRDLVDPHLEIGKHVDERYVTAFSESQTSGGLLAAVDPGIAQDALRAVRHAGDQSAEIVGSVVERPPGLSDEVYLEIEP